MKTEASDERGCGADARSVVWEFARLDASDDRSMIGVIVSDMVDDFVVVLEAKFAVGAGVGLLARHGFSSSHLPDRR